MRELKKELKRIDHGGKEECVMCRFVLIFAFAVLLLVITFTFFFKMKNEHQLVPLPKDQAPFPTAEEWDQRIIDLGYTVHGSEFNSTATNTPK